MFLVYCVLGAYELLLGLGEGNHERLTEKNL